jgi:hypothetical protein
MAEMALPVPTTVYSVLTQGDGGFENEMDVLSENLVVSDELGNRYSS